MYKIIKAFSFKLFFFVFVSFVWQEEVCLSYYKSRTDSR